MNTNNRRPVRRDEIITAVIKRPDKQLYERPSPNPFTEDWNDGYECGCNGEEPILGLRNSADYWDGVFCGQEQRKELDASGSSNT